MTVSHKASSEYYTDPASTPYESTSFSWVHSGGSGTDHIGGLVFTHTKFDIDAVYCVSYGGKKMQFIGNAVGDLVTTGTVSAWFIGDLVPGGDQVINISRYDSGKPVYCAAITLAANHFLVVNDLTSQAEFGLLGEVDINDAGNSPGASLRYASALCNLANPIGPGSNSTILHAYDYGSESSSTARETIAGVGERPVGFNSTFADHAALFLAVREIPRNFVFYS